MLTFPFTAFQYAAHIADAPKHFIFWKIIYLCITLTIYFLIPV